jgi:hypothetical protein
MLAPAEVHNFGLPGTGTDQHYIAIDLDHRPRRGAHHRVDPREYGDGYQPD